MEIIDKSKYSKKELINSFINNLSAIELSTKDMQNDIEELYNRELIDVDQYIFSKVAVRELYNKLKLWYKIANNEVDIVKRAKRINNEML